MPKGQRSPDRPRETERSASVRVDEFTIDASGVEVGRASAWLDALCSECDVPQDLTERLALCLHETLANVVAHGGADARRAPVHVRLEISRGRARGEASVTVSDVGIAFDPLSVRPRTMPKTLAEAPVGGLGLVMIRRLADWLDYRREGGRNRFTFGMHWSVQ